MPFDPHATLPGLEVASSKARGADAPASDTHFVEVAIPIPSRQLFTYAVPPDLRSLAIGQRVAVPFGKRKLAGIVVAHTAAAPPKHVRAIAGVLEEEPVFDRELLAFLLEAADYYLHPIGDVLRAAAPALRSESVRQLKESGFLRSADEFAGEKVPMRAELWISRANTPESLSRLGTKQKAILALLQAREEVSLTELRAHVPDPRRALDTLVEKGFAKTRHASAQSDRFFERPIERDQPFVPSEDQARAIEVLDRAIGSDAARTFLLEGITGSGKTEVYLRAIETARARGKGALLLVPEIALTPQLVARFRARFGDRIAVLHSAQSARKRADAWRALRSGEVTLAIGARSAVFAPVRDLGVIVVDEEHDPSYKQEEGFRYNARDLAVLRAHRTSAIAILGSATPSLETYQHACKGRYEHLVLRARPSARSLPRVHVVDLRRQSGGPIQSSMLGGRLHRAIEETMERGEQALLFLNRRGFAPTLRCRNCDEVQVCPACSVPLTEHRRANLLRCHYCEFATTSDRPCSSCKEWALVPVGAGTEKIEDELAEVFPSARIARLDRDTATKDSLESVLDRVRAREVDILVGTQMVTKGHDLPGVTLVGVLLADQSLAFPDFRAAERTFQLLTQVAGRAGRGDAPGQVIVQTYQPHHPAIVAAARQDFRQFAELERESRRELGYPPFGRLVAVRLDHPDLRRAEQAIERLAVLARDHACCAEGLVELMGPAPAPIERLRGRYRQRFFLRSHDRRALRAVAEQLVREGSDAAAGARFSVDVDPVSML